MAKIMISVPDELLARLDAHARRHGKTRSGLVQELAERELHGDRQRLQRELADLLAGASSHGGQGARFVREQRNAR